MTDRDPDAPRVNPGYATSRIARALATSVEHDDPTTRERARGKITKWLTVLDHILSGEVAYGSRTPVDAPAWATPEVVTGGFATGGLLAGGPLQEHERSLLERLGTADGRLALNAHFLSENGVAELQAGLRTGCYDVDVPEEAALMVVAWLAGNGRPDDARQLIDVLSPWFGALRFYPRPLDRPVPSGPRVHVSTVNDAIAALRRIEPHPRILAQRQAVEDWLPLHDGVVALFLETVADDWPCRRWPPGWRDRARALLRRHAQLRERHGLHGKSARAGGHAARLRALLARCAASPAVLTARDVGQIRHILACYVRKRGAPGSPSWAQARQRQRADVGSPPHHEIARAILPRLAGLPGDGGVDDTARLTGPVDEAESEDSGLPEGTPVPAALQRRIDRCLNEAAAVLVARGLITSGESLARILPQMVADIRGAGIADPALRRLYGAVYRAFRRRRSLLLFNLESQVGLGELPWVAAIDTFRNEDLSTRALARETLRELALLVIAAFPHAIIPNKLLQEMRALAASAALAIPLVDELAADIFMGKFSPKFLQAAKQAGDLLGGSLYATYYGVDYEKIRSRIRDDHKFAALCTSRAGVAPGWNVVSNGMIIEQQQILTTQNLAALVTALDLTDTLRGQSGDFARQCFRWICRRHRIKQNNRHAQLIMLKNTAYAWRQMMFFLALLPAGDVAAFVSEAERHLNTQPGEFRDRFRPALDGLILAADGRSPEGARRFLGWSKQRHWLMAGNPAPH